MDHGCAQRDGGDGNRRAHLPGWNRHGGRHGHQAGGTDRHRDQRGTGLHRTDRDGESPGGPQIETRRGRDQGDELG